MFGSHTFSRCSPLKISKVNSQTECVPLREREGCSHIWINHFLGYKIAVFRFVSAVVCCILRWHEQLYQSYQSSPHCSCYLTVYFAGWQFPNLYWLIIGCWVLQVHILDPKPQACKYIYGSFASSAHLHIHAINVASYYLKKNAPLLLLLEPICQYTTWRRF